MSQAFSAAERRQTLATAGGRGLSSAGMAARRKILSPLRGSSRFDLQIHGLAGRG